MNNSESKMLLIDSNGNTQEFNGEIPTITKVPTITGVDFATGSDRTGCFYVNTKLQISGTLLFDKKTTDSFKLAFIERDLKILQSWQYYKVRPGRIRRCINSLKRKIKVIKNRHLGDAEWLKNMDFIRNLI